MAKVVITIEKLRKMKPGVLAARQVAFKKKVFNYILEKSKDGSYRIIIDSKATRKIKESTMVVLLNDNVAAEYFAVDMLKIMARRNEL